MICEILRAVWAQTVARYGVEIDGYSWRRHNNLVPTMLEMET